MPAPLALLRWIAPPLLMVAAAVQAAPAALYSGEAVVANQEADERARVLGVALTAALVKVSGDPTLAADPALAAALERAPQLLTQFSYRQSIDRRDGSLAPRLILVAEFDRAGVDALLGELGRATWGDRRPRTLVWLVVDDGAGVRRIASASQVAALDAMTGAARGRGIELVLPVMDAEDFGKIDADALWSGPTERALLAAQRYGTPAVLVARLARSGNGWSGRFSLLAGDATEHFTVTFADSNSVLAAGANGLADRLAQRFAIAASERKIADYRVWVADVRSATDYARVMGYLGGLSVVSAIEPEGADGDRLLLKLTLNVGLDRLRQLLALDRTLRIADDVPGEGTQATLTLAH
jgi:hypothetical protein